MIGNIGNSYQDFHKTFSWFFCRLRAR